MVHALTTLLAQNEPYKQWSGMHCLLWTSEDRDDIINKTIRLLNKIYWYLIIHWYSDTDISDCDVDKNYGGHFHFKFDGKKRANDRILHFRTVYLLQYLGPSITTSYGSPNRKGSQIPLRLTEVESSNCSNSVLTPIWSVDVSSGNFPS